MTYIWQQKNWPGFQYQADAVSDKLLAFMEKAGRIGGLLDGLPDETRTETIIDIMVSEAIKTSEIEGEFLSRRDVMSSIRMNLGLSTGTEKPSDQRSQGIAELMLTVRDHFAEPLSENMLFDWHRKLMRGTSRVSVGAWRTHSEPMQVVSGPIGREKVHYEAPPSSQVSHEMVGFINWFNRSQKQEGPISTQPLIHAAIAHLYFETIHPFEDGNGRIGRAIAEKSLSLGLGRPVLLSLSKTIEANREDYYKALQQAQRSHELDMTPWLIYFTDVCLDAQSSAEKQITFTLKKVRFFDRYRDQLNERQTKVINRMLEEGPDGFEGGMNARKYMGIAKTSKATATRDLQDLAAHGILHAEGGGRSTRYVLQLD